MYENGSGTIRPIAGVSPRGIWLKRCSAPLKWMCSNFSRNVSFTFELIPLGKAGTSLSSQLWLFFFYKGGFGIK